ncbi:DNA replication and checkpoint protein-domain-containing protein [Alternaria alternata]|nr:DNA replication and checkpoint protein-domain-containing protein [Alternaria alternata]
MSNDEIEQRCTELRHELKAWEKKFSAENNGRKAGRDDIKANAEISQMYKDYNKLRVRLSSKAAPQTPSKRTPSRRASLDVERTPKAAPKPTVSTPLKRKREDGDAIENVDLAAELLSPQGPTVIGPTPQRDGIVLGLFDMLPYAYGTPSKPRTVLGDVGLNVPQTPSRGLQDAASETSLESRARGERTPLSAGKRFLLNQFVTPKKRRLDEEGTPSSTTRGLATPAFLRRDNVLNAIDEEEEPISRPAPWMRRGLGRSLSSMIQAMRKDEDDKLDEEADIMRELEMEEEGIAVPRKPRASQILIEDSQAAMPLGPDRGLESDEGSEEEPELGPDGKPRRVWKKKGLKRQTRRVIMRPNIVKPKPTPAPQTNDDPEGEQAGVPETQVPAVLEDEFGSNLDGDSDYASDASHTPRRKVPAKKPEQAKEKPVKESALKTAARKIKATANANYRRLNIKGKAGTGAKGKTFEGGYDEAWRLGSTLSPAPPTPTVSRRIPPKLPLAATNTPTTSRIRPTQSPRPVSISSTCTTKTEPPHTMAERELSTVLQQLHQTLKSHNYQQSTSLLGKAKIALLNLNALIPQEKTPRKHLQLARETLELGAIISIRLKDTESFTRYFQQLQPFYSLPESTLPKDGSNSSKVTGLYLLLLLSEGDYAGFHTLLETLEVAAAQAGTKLEADQFIQYPIKLEQALMEGSYDKVWVETKSERVPGEEFALFTEILIGTIRKEIASCSERAYPSIPISDAKSLLFLDSEGSVVNFAKECGWVVKDGRIYFPQQEDEYMSRDILVTSDQVIENTLGYARELETIV